MMIERIHSMNKLIALDRPTKDRVLGIVMKSMIFEEGFEVLNFAFQLTVA